MIVVKLGGSLYNTPELRAWLNILDEVANQQPIIIVPGGGPFANQVRDAQQLHQFDDSHAHHMAILAMAQFGLLIKGIIPNCQMFYFPTDKLVTTPKGLSVWLPNKSLLSQAEIMHSWTITSDSLALWLANKLNTEQLILVKRNYLNNNRSITELSKLGVVDTSFQHLFSQTSVPSQIVDAQDHQHFSERLADNTDSILFL
ncbi:MAG TPA: delta 1-pyrroline-5-carboxylate synthetase [Methylophaga sp.]|nr:delta 1-pyrroline-5-carboxylate synthetase [Methylophaga sp.]